MKHFIDTHDKSNGSFPTEQQFFERVTGAESSLAALATLHDQGAASSIAILAELVA